MLHTCIQFHAIKWSLFHLGKAQCRTLVHKTTKVMVTLPGESTVSYTRTQYGTVTVTSLGQNTVHLYALRYNDGEQLLYLWVWYNGKVAVTSLKQSTVSYTTHHLMQSPYLVKSTAHLYTVRLCNGHLTWSKVQPICTQYDAVTVTSFGQKYSPFAYNTIQ